MDLIADMLLLSAALGAGLYCFVLARRLRRFTDLESGMGGAVAVLSVQVEDMKKALDSARTTARDSAERLEEVTARAEETARRLEMTMATTHDLPHASAGSAQPGGRTVRRRRRSHGDETEEVAA